MALVGPNGSGKSTLLQVLLGLAAARGRARSGCSARRPTGSTSAGGSGTCRSGPSLGPRCRRRSRRSSPTGRLRQRGWWRSPERRGPRRRCEHAIESVGLGDVADRPLNELSGGQQQRAFIARAFASEPELLVLDEPIAGVDAESQRRFRDSLVHLIGDHGAGVLLVSHELSAVANDVSTG